jgi:DUF1009 family protein
VVVVRHYVLAIEAAEGAAVMLERAARLRQWGLRWPRAGVMVRRADGERSDTAGLEALLAQAAAQQLAGIALTGSAGALSAYEDAGRTADRHGLFLALCEAI